MREAVVVLLAEERLEKRLGPPSSEIAERLLGQASERLGLDRQFPRAPLRPATLHSSVRIPEASTRKSLILHCSNAPQASRCVAAGTPWPSKDLAPSACGLQTAAPENVKITANVKSRCERRLPTVFALQRGDPRGD